MYVCILSTYHGLSNDTTLEPILSGRSVPLNFNLFLYYSMLLIPATETPVAMAVPVHQSAGVNSSKLI